MADTPDTGQALVIETVARNLATKLAVAVLVWLGGWLVSHGLATEDQMRQAIDPVAQIVAGVLLSIASLVLIWARSLAKRRKETALVEAHPAEVVVK